MNLVPRPLQKRQIMSVIYPGSERSTLEFIAGAADCLEYNEATGTLYSLLPGDGTPCAVISASQIYQATLRSMLRPVAVLRTCPLCQTWWHNPDPAYDSVRHHACPECGRDQRSLPEDAADLTCDVCIAKHEMRTQGIDELRVPRILPTCVCCGSTGHSQGAPGKLRCKECKQASPFSGVGRDVECQICSKHRYKISKRSDCDLCALEREVRIADGWCGACGSPGARQ